MINIGVSSVIWEGEISVFKYLQFFKWMDEKSKGLWTSQDQIEYYLKTEYARKTKTRMLLGFKTYKVSEKAQDKVSLFAMPLLYTKKEDGKWYWKLTHDCKKIVDTYKEDEEKAIDRFFLHLLKYSPFTRAFYYNLGKLNRTAVVKRGIDGTPSWGDLCKNLYFLDDESNKITAEEAIAGLIMKEPLIIGQHIRTLIKRMLNIDIDNESEINVIRYSYNGDYTSPYYIRNMLEKVEECKGMMESEEVESSLQKLAEISNLLNKTIKSAYPSLSKAEKHFTLGGERDLLLKKIKEENGYLYFRLNEDKLLDIVDEPILLDEIFGFSDFFKIIMKVYKDNKDVDGWMSMVKMREKVNQILNPETDNIIEWFDSRLQRLINERKIFVNWKPGYKELGEGFQRDGTKMFINIGMG